MNATLLVMAGGALGAAGRYHLGRLVFHLGGTGFPMGTLAANLLGGFLMGILAGVLARSNFVDEPWRLFLGVGLLGGFTTFSAFSLEVMNMIERGMERCRSAMRCSRSLVRYWHCLPDWLQ